MRPWTRIPVAALLALGVAAPAQASHGANVFSGSWTTNIGGVAFTVIDGSQGAQALQTLAGQPCGAPTVYYRGDYYDANNTGVIVACTRGPTRLTGRYISNGSQRPQGDGAVDITFASPGQFSGHYTGDEFPGQTFTYTGTFQSHLDGDGCCPATAPPPPPPPGQTPEPCPGGRLASIAQGEGLGEGEFCYIITTGPERGKVVRGKAPKVGPEARALSGEITFVDDQGQPVEGLTVAAVEEQAQRASVVCWTLFDNSGIVRPAPFVFIPDRYASCIDTVARVLARYDQILKRREANPGATAAARRCPAKPAHRRGRRRVRRKLRVTCTPTATGLKITLRPRSRRQSLRAALGGRAPKVLLGRSGLGPPGQVQTVGVWTAK